MRMKKNKFPHTKITRCGDRELESYLKKKQIFECILWFFTSSLYAQIAI